MLYFVLNDWQVEVASTCHPQKKVWHFFHRVRAAMSKAAGRCFFLESANLLSSPTADAGDDPGRVLLHRKSRCQRFHIFDWGFRQNAMTEIKNVSGTPGGATQNRLKRATSSSFQSANSRTGSRLPHPARHNQKPRLRQPSSSGMRQSSPITSAPVSRIDAQKRGAVSYQNKLWVAPVFCNASSPVR